MFTQCAHDVLYETYLTLHAAQEITLMCVVQSITTFHCCYLKNFLMRYVPRDAKKERKERERYFEMPVISNHQSRAELENEPNQHYDLKKKSFIFCECQA
ncbi:CLUMA_CG000519, isoform A [Clunio marinus]|uniref:CLUMA_CG000519, isoform A n=1 Tax=Clunio marinus TaxID=568069 RepID=A0A1J1HJN7_9DIPT|nr:CLUMA_CG000519, isoform A [Clunio marinus]